VLTEYLERPWFPRLLLFLLIFTAAIWIDLTGTMVGRALLPAIASTTGVAEGMLPRLLIAIVLGVALVGNVALIRVLPFRVQILVVWVELLAVFLLFFYSFDLSYPYIVPRLPILIFTGAFTTIYISLISISIACVIALAGALARLSQSAPAYAAATFYISFFRGTPLLLQVYLIYLGLPQLGVTLEAVPSGIIALSLCYGAYMAEIFRAGIEGVPGGQREAAMALGLRKGLIMRKIVLPQAMRLIVPPTGNQFIAMLKDSSLVSVMGVWELMFLARTQGRAEFRHLEMLITAAIIYWIISIVFELVQARIEAYYGKGVQS
jgi:polar amino acid transport system permease protein